ncbi:MAG TPA: ABC transporter permease, partial [Lacipirellulaceae bacterium]|nr:ABC transporter permease [Lacipirellulaceae bacterium]
MMLYWRFAWRELRQRPSRPILTLLSVVIGVAAVVAVTIASGTTHRAFDQIFKTVAGNASLEVTSEIGANFDEKVVDKIRQVPGVKVVAPLMKRNTSLGISRGDKQKKSFRLVAIGVDPKVDREVHDYEITEGKSLADQPGFLLEENFAKSQNIKVGEIVDIMTPMDFPKAPVVGLFSSKGTAATSEGASLYLPINATQEFWRSRGKIDSAQIVTEPDADQETVKKSIAQVLPKGITVQPPPARSAMAEETSLSTEQGMRMARGFSLLVAIFIIANTFLINVTQRRRQIGIMRAIGATRGQIAGMMYREALLMGVLGTILGSLLG